MPLSATVKQYWLSRRVAEMSDAEIAQAFEQVFGAKATRGPPSEADQVEARRLEHVRRAAEELGATVLLKGSTTVIAEVGRPVRVNPTGTPRLATAGSGDVLSGLIGAFLAGGTSALDAAAAGAYLHGLAGRLAAGGDTDAEAPISAFDVIDAIPGAFRTLSA